MKVRFAVSPGVDGWDDDTLPEFVDALELLGFDTIWLSDIPMGPQIDPIVGLAFAASRTKRLKLGANVVPIGRNPMMLAKELAQLDRLSHGRVLLSLVPGLDQPGERQALGIGDSNRGRIIDELIPLLRQWWRGERIDHCDHSDARFDFCGVQVRPLPVQNPLEIWLGGIGPVALRRAGRLADGWLGAAVTPEEAGVAIAEINRAADEADRIIDPEHFGLSIPYATIEPDPAIVAAFRARRPSGPVEQMFPVGAAQLRDLIGRLVEHGVSKFVVRLVGDRGAWRDDLQQLADTVLDLQT